MKFIVLVIASLTSFATASDHKCKPATYRCEASKRAWDVCNTSGDWVFAGRCPPGTICKFNKVNGSPYCLPRGYTIVEVEVDEVVEEAVEEGQDEI